MRLEWLVILVLAIDGYSHSLTIYLTMVIGFNQGSVYQSCICIESLLANDCWLSNHVDSSYSCS